MSPKRIVLSNSYGTPNVGDVAILSVLVTELCDRGFDVDVLTFTPEDTVRNHPRATAVRSGVFAGLFDTLKAIRRADALVVGGGGIIQDATSFGNLLLHVSRPVMASMVSTPIVITGVGIGPLKWIASRWLTRRICAAASIVVVRDERSGKLLEKIGVSSARVRRGADFAHLLPKQEPSDMDDTGVALIETLRAARARNRPLVGLSLRPAVGGASRRAKLSNKDRSRLEEMAKAADRIVEAHDAQIVFISMHAQQDDSLAKALVRKMRHRDRVSLVPGKLPPATIKAAVAELDVMLGMRLHSIIFAACSGVPPIALAYDDKVAAYLESLGLDDQVLSEGDWQADVILQRVRQTLESSDRITGRLAAMVPDFIDAAIHSVDQISDIAQGK